MTDISRLGRPTPRYNDPLPEGGELIFKCRIIGHPKPPKSQRDEGAGSRQWREVTKAQLTVFKNRQLIAPIDEPVIVEAIFLLPAPRHPKFPLPATGDYLNDLCHSLGGSLKKNRRTQRPKPHHHMDSQKTLPQPPRRHSSTARRATQNL